MNFPLVKLGAAPLLHLCTNKAGNKRKEQKDYESSNLFLPAAKHEDTFISTFLCKALLQRKHFLTLENLQHESTLK